MVLNPITDIDYRKKLREFGLNESGIAEFENEISANYSDIEDEYNKTKRSEKTILNKGNKNLNQVNQDIADLKKKRDDDLNRLKTIIEQNTTIKFIPEKYEDCIHEGFTFFNKKIEDTEVKLLDTREKELFYEPDRYVASEGRLADDIAKIAKNVLDQMIQKYTKVSHYRKIQELENDEFKTNKEGTSDDNYRKLEKVWLYPVQGEKDNFLLTVVAKFKIVRKH
ncbi:MAG: hypothetical protein HY958_07095 [Bacteroidia bacterium]|nr:hypothetical protein [Bacteroidia bacterium]